jgi:hypothetical protein
MILPEFFLHVCLDTGGTVSFLDPSPFFDSSLNFVKENLLEFYENLL